MTNVFQSQANAAPYEAVKPRVSIDDRNPAQSATAARSNRMNFEEADDIDDDELNDISSDTLYFTPLFEPGATFH